MFCVFDYVCVFNLRFRINGFKYDYNWLLFVFFFFEFVVCKNVLIIISILSMIFWFS